MTKVIKVLLPSRCFSYYDTKNLIAVLAMVRVLTNHLLIYKRLLVASSLILFAKSYLCPMPQQVNIEPQWYEVLKTEFEQPYFKALKDFLLAEKNAGHTIYPNGGQIFSAFTHTPFSQVKVVILGQDPYHGAGQAHGLCFSVNKGIAIPPSLKNIYKELYADLNIVTPLHGYLLPWAAQGVLMLNATLTVRANEAGSHQGKGWETFTDKVIEILNHQKQNIVFILWGKYAQSKSVWINEQQHCVLKAPHPSPFSAHTGFLGSKPFSKTNAYLVEKGIAPIDWQLL